MPDDLQFPRSKISQACSLSPCSLARGKAVEPPLQGTGQQGGRLPRLPLDHTNSQFAGITEQIQPSRSKYFEVGEPRPFPEGKAVAGQSPRNLMESKGSCGHWCTRSSTGTSVLPEMPPLQTSAKVSSIILPPFYRLTYLSPPLSS